MSAPDLRMDPVNATGRFLLELAAAYGIGAGVWTATSSWWATTLVVAIALVVWGTFRVPDDPGPAPRPVPGWVRLLIEAVVLGTGGWGLLVAHGPAVSGVFFALIGIHYATTPRRLRHLLAHRGFG